MDAIDGRRLFGRPDDGAGGAVGRATAAQSSSSEDQKTASPAAKAPAKPARVPAAGAPPPTSKINLDISETLFSFTAALGACGFGQPAVQEADAAQKNPLRAQIWVSCNRPFRHRTNWRSLPCRCASFIMTIKRGFEPGFCAVCFSGAVCGWAAYF